MGRGAEKRDTELLGSAASVLKRAAAAAGLPKATVPWEAAGQGADDEGSPTPAVALVAERVPMLNVRLFGGFELLVGDEYVSDAHWRRKTRLAFAELALKQGKDLAREELLHHLWPDASRTKALDGFYTVWSCLNTALGKGPYLEKNGDFCRLNMRYVNSDIGEFERLTRTLLAEREDMQVLLDTYASIEAVYRGDLLPSEKESALVNARRERYHSMFADCMVSATGKALETGDVRLALWFARKGIEAEQRREDVYLALLRAQMAAGQRCSALRTYFKCQAFLRDEMGLDPSFEMQSLYEELITVDPSLLRVDAAALGIT